MRRQMKMNHPQSSHSRDHRFSVRVQFPRPGIDTRSMDSDEFYEQLLSATLRYCDIYSCKEDAGASREELREIKKEWDQVEGWLGSNDPPSDQEAILKRVDSWLAHYESGML